MSDTPSAVAGPARLPLGLYVHLPWCVAKCPYCDFNSHALKGDLNESRYLDALLADLDTDAALVGRRHVRTIFIGGGTPSLFSTEAIARLLGAIRARLPVADEAEVTLEANPGTVELARFAGYRAAGVNRLSIGVQSFSNDSLRALGRIHDAAQAQSAIRAASKAGFDNVNIDLMFGLPGQRVQEAMTDVRCALDASVTHISYYQLTLEPNTLFHARPPVLPDDDTVWEMQSQGQAELERAGYRQYEVSAFARPGRACRHNLNYWRFGDYLGLGAGAHGKISLTDGRRIRSWKQRHPEHYIRTAGTPEQTAGLTTLAPEDRVFEYMLNALRLVDGFESADFLRTTGLDIEAAAGAVLRAALARGLLARNGQHWAPTALGRRFLNDLQGMFLNSPKERRPARASTLGS